MLTSFGIHLACVADRQNRRYSPGILWHVRLQRSAILSPKRKCFMVLKHNVHRQQPEKSEIFIFSGLSLSRLVDTNLTSVWTTERLCVFYFFGKKFASKCYQNISLLSGCCLWTLRDHKTNRYTSRETSLPCKSLFWEKNSRGLRFSWHPNFDLPL